MFLDNVFGNIWGLFALFTLIPFIIVYLIRPKPKDKVIPSLMFLIKKDRKMKENSFLKKLLDNLLFLIQLLVILLLAFSVASPYFKATVDISAEDMVIVLDASASMDTKDNGDTRFEKAVKLIKKDYLSGKNTIILAGNIPEILIQDGTTKGAIDALNNVKQKHTTTNLGDAMMFGADYLETNKGMIVVVSDFINSETDPITTKNALESKNIKVEFVDVSGEAENIGIIDLIIDKDTTIMHIKNFNDKEEEIKISVKGSDEKITIAPKSAETFSFPTPKGTTEIKLDIKDDFSIDNYAYISTPSDEKTKVLYISNKPLDNLYYALTSSSRNSVETVVPPIVPKVNHDIYIIKEVDVDLLLPETIREIGESVEKGSSFIIVMQNDLFDIDFKEILALEYLGRNDAGSYVKVEQINSFTRDVEFGSTKKYLKTKVKGDSVVITSDKDGYPLITYSKLGLGNVIYYGINDAESEFTLSPTYPIFWNNLLEFLLDRDSIKSLNFMADQTISGKNIDTTGIHDLGTKKVAVNLLSEKESDVSKTESIEKQDIRTDENRFERKVPVDLDTYFIIIAIVFIMGELLYIKYRGDF
ncbi:BatA domain-containing protein [Candidatus Woesearchaeota archaeon]|nr:BatA domain-containing protein [Candidatus Woesearchaeota archaeon]